MDIEKEIISMLDGEMNEETLSEFKDIMKNNKELLKDKLIYEKIITQIKSEGENDLRKELDLYLQEHLEKEVKAPLFRLFEKPIFYLSIAASLLIVFFAVNYNSEKTSQEIILKSIETPIRMDSASYKEDSIQLQKKSTK